MKNANLFQWLSTVAVLGLALSWVQPVALAQQDRDPAAPTAEQSGQPEEPSSSGDQQLEMKTFTGKVVELGDKLVLQDSIGESTYQLDDQRQAEGFLGRNVKVTGAVDVVTQTIHIARIEAEQ